MLNQKLRVEIHVSLRLLKKFFCTKTILNKGKNVKYLRHFLNKDLNMRKKNQILNKLFSGNDCILSTEKHKQKN